MSISDALWFRRTILTGAAMILLALVAVPALHLFGRDPGAAVADSATAAERAADLEAFEKPEITDDENAARWLEAGAGAIVWSDEDREWIGSASTMPYGDWPAPLREGVRATLERHRGAVETMHKAAAYDQSSYGIAYSEGFRAETPDLLGLLRAQRLLLADARVAFADADEQRGLRVLATMARLASSLEEESTLITALVGIAAERMMLVAACEAVASNQAWAAHDGFLDDLSAVTVGLDHGAMMRRVAGAWGATLLHAVASGEHSLDLGPRGGTIEIPEDFTGPDLARAQGVVDQLVAVAFGSDTELFETAAERAGLADDGVGKDLGGIAKGVARAQSVQAQRQLLHAAIAVRRLGRDAGSYPAQRPRIPELSEPDPFTGRPISYSVGGDGAAVLALDDAAELLERVALKTAVDSLAPVTLPPPG